MSKDPKQTQDEAAANETEANRRIDPKEPETDTGKTSSLSDDQDAFLKALGKKSKS